MNLAFNNPLTPWIALNPNPTKIQLKACPGSAKALLSPVERNFDVNTKVFSIMAMSKVGL
jgi:hypothetical protein